MRDAALAQSGDLFLQSGNGGGKQVVEHYQFYKKRSSGK
jgi:hypothetical protein